MRYTLHHILYEVRTELRRALFRYKNPLTYQNYQNLRLQKAPGSEYSLEGYDRYGCIFVRIPKNATQSISLSLFGNLGGGHLPILKYNVIYSRKEFQNYFKFTFVRNPWDRLVSAYHFLRAGGVGNEHDMKWKERLEKYYPTFDTFLKEWVNSKDVAWGMHFKSQYQFVCDENFRIMVDFVGYFENLESDFDYVKKKLGVNTSLTNVNKTKSKKNHYRNYYSSETAEIVARVYHHDIRIFGYNFDDNRSAPPAITYGQVVS